ncbi:sugar phosphate isomerase/epimerase family protein [Simiduia aestuariiviva]|uniref:Sugar phosphate isomerase/epimerase n=1 Tax=Simiduia aestuariiviva TaxID=1510459 RepID=A0A839ULE0_9GAMM|nr:TIM barrel protein [Simiduia aestuariiviva]MBB3167389.1 sugar phosphate isomerase/epimerase [Simiduia aestuariiviva]
MNRREFIATLGALTFTAKCQHLFASNWKPNIGLQLFTVRDQLKSDKTGLLQTIAEIGYSTLQSSSVDEAVDLHDMANHVGLTFTSSHTDPATIFDPKGNLLKSYHEPFSKLDRLGIKQVVFSSPFTYFDAPKDESAAIERADFYKRLAQSINQIHTNKDIGDIEILFHPHSVDFGKLLLTTPFQLLTDNTEPTSLGFEVDTFWTSMAGVDPANLIKALGTRCRSLHLSDRRPNFKNSYNSLTTFMAKPNPAAPLGRGILDFDSICNEIRAIQCDHLYIEQAWIGDSYKETLENSIQLLTNHFS